MEFRMVQDTKPCQSVLIKWLQGCFDLDTIGEVDSEHLEGIGFYALHAAVDNLDGLCVYDLLYIGKTYEQSLRERIQQGHEDIEDCLNLFRNRGYTIVVSIGILYRLGQSRLTEQLFRDIECCLIYSNKPICNDKCKKSYTGRPLIIHNIGDCINIKRLSLCNCY